MPDPNNIGNQQNETNPPIVETTNRSGIAAMSVILETQALDGDFPGETMP